MTQAPAHGKPVAAPQAGLPSLHESLLPREHSLHRPRHGGRQLFSLICAAIFFATPLVSLALGVRPAEFENRRLADFPDILAGWDFWSGLSPWASDHLVFRDDAIRAADQISRGVFGEPPPFGGEHRQQQVPSGPIVVDQPKRKEENNIVVPAVIEGTNGWMYLGDDVVTRCKQATSVDATMTQLKRLRDGVVASGREFVLVIAPDKSTAVPEYLPPTFVGQDCLRRVNTEMWQRLTAEDYVLDLRSDLRIWAAQNGRPAYPPLDAHWGDEGGLIMARRLAEWVEPGITKGWVVSPGQPWNALGDLPPLIGRSGPINGVRYVVQPGGAGDRDQTRDQPVDFSTPLRFTTATGSGTISEKVGMLGDSFSIRSMRYLAAAFGDMTIQHYGKADKDAGKSTGELLADNKIVVLELVERTVAAGNSTMLIPAVVDGVVAELARHPLR
jgi:alginate O-acetyltransferase complex protein AlgJ